MKIITTTITKARKDLFKVAESVQEKDTFYSLTIDGIPQVVIMSQDSFEKLNNDNKYGAMVLREDSEVKYRVKKRKK
ncbi:MAG: hypothetical protein AUJ34_01665 [Parcubacteria group bacterium CG1_02_41_12]|nr:MAG: hypothetical protein AUJ34_01665 [Parcubacteria group bacterium CG1_02_41_12]PIP66813.1 MAG: hypothetical protein COW93_03615 [Parcubacteria group bacterium CG22_combo_CG10-13_8_21_14_all_41_9]PIZ81071.1 MAG: hypothetical protein COY02_03160 [Parcubacteria group bacterium CG_4_10_14_0_2_um_filter_41_6]